MAKIKLIFIIALDLFEVVEMLKFQIQKQNKCLLKIATLSTWTMWVCELRKES